MITDYNQAWEAKVPQTGRFLNSYGSFTSVSVRYPRQRGKFIVETCVRAANEDGTQRLQPKRRVFDASEHSDFMQDLEARINYFQ